MAQKIVVTQTVLAPATEVVEGLKLPYDYLQDYMKSKGTGESLTAEFWSGLRSEMGLDQDKKYKIRIIGVVLEK